MGSNGSVVSVDLKDVLEVVRMQLAQSQQDSAMNAALAMAERRAHEGSKKRIEELEGVLREMKANPK